MSHRYLKGIAATMVVGLGVAACSSGHSGSSSSSGSAKTTSITEEAVTGVTFIKNFNPFDVNSFASQVDAKSLLYEPLFEFDALKPGVIHPQLGTKYAWSNGGKTLTVTLRQGVKFSDGQPFTSADAAFTFNTIKANAAANYSGLPTITSVSAPDASTLVLNFQAAQYANLFSILGNTFMVPKHTFSSLSNVATASVALGILVGTIADGDGAQGLTMALYLVLAALGGLWMPVQILPSALQTVAKTLPSYHLAQLGWHIAQGVAPAHAAYRVRLA